MAALLDSQVVTVATAMLVQRVVFSAIGLASIYMGYRLFMADKLRGGAQVDGDFESRTESAGSGNLKISLGRGGPGLLFALFGMAIALAAVLKPMSVEAQDGGAQQAQLQSAGPSGKGPNAAPGGGGGGGHIKMDMGPQK